MGVDRSLYLAVMSLSRIGQLAVILLASTSACSSDTVRIDLDGVWICPPSDYVRQTPIPWLRGNNDSYDNSYTEILLRAPSKNINPDDPNRVRLLVTNRSAISGFSQQQKELIKLAKSEPSRFSPAENSPYYAVKAWPESSFSGYDLVRWMPKGDEGTSSEALHSWIVASHCNIAKIGYKYCTVQRIYDDFAYQYTHRGDPAKIDFVVKNIELELESLRNACAQET